MTLTGIIVQELLDAVNSSTEVDAVFKRYGHSKGPFYLALAQATTCLQERLDQTCREIAATEVRKGCLQQDVDALEVRYHEMDEEAAALDQRVNQAEAHLDEARGLLDQVHTLARQGFNEDHLNRLSQLLAEIAASQGAPPEEGVTQFFVTVQRYERIVSLGLEAKSAETRVAQAKADADRWEAEARQKEVHSKARLAYINALERLLTQGVKEDDLLHWTRILTKAEKMPEDLANALEGYASAEALLKDQQQQIAKLQGEAKTLMVQVEALREEREEVSIAINGIEKHALQAMQQTSLQAQQHLQTMMDAAQQHGDLQRQVEELSNWVTLARAFKERSKEQWQQTSTGIIQELLLGLACWGSIDGRTQMITPPEYLLKTPRFSSLVSVAFVDLMLWASDAEDAFKPAKALPSGSR